MLRRLLNPRSCRAIRSLAAIGIVFTFTAWCCSIRWYVAWWGQSASFSLGGGQVTLWHWVKGDPSMAWTPLGWSYGRHESNLAWHPIFSYARGTLWVLTPLWIPAIALAAIGAAATPSIRLLSPRNACRHCGYDLTGNRGALCPECGKKSRRAR